MSEDASRDWQRQLTGLAARLEQALPGHWAEVECLASVPSTNHHLLACRDLVPERYRVCLAREQTAGHGRRGRAWISAGEASLSFSVARALRPGEIPNPALTLAIGVGLSRALIRCGYGGFGLKWPNDVVTADQAKLAGILVEARGAGVDHQSAVVVGVGLNRSGAQALDVDRAVADLTDLPGPSSLRLADLLEAVLTEMVQAWEGFACYGLMPFVEEYARLDALRGQRIRVSDTGAQGMAVGIDGVDGALLLQQPEGLTRLYSGDVSVQWLGHG